VVERRSASFLCSNSNKIWQAALLVAACLCNSAVSLEDAFSEPTVNARYLQPIDALLEPQEALCWAAFRTMVLRRRDE
jgi:hypothetical protein